MHLSYTQRFPVRLWVGVLASRVCNLCLIKYERILSSEIILGLGCKI
nr:MAG TPA: hypothetical protein [Bacteriophage sp.]